MLKPKKNILVVFILFICIGYTYSEASGDIGSPLNTQISLHLKDVTTQLILDSISAKYQINFSYNSDLVRRSRKQTVSFYSEPLENILVKLFDGEDIGIDYIGDQVIIFKNNHLNIAEIEETNTCIKTITGNIVDKKKPTSCTLCTCLFQ